jgi:hypothetical protein
MSAVASQECLPTDTRRDAKRSCVATRRADGTGAGSVRRTGRRPPPVGRGDRAARASLPAVREPPFPPPVGVSGAACRGQAPAALARPEGAAALVG